MKKNSGVNEREVVTGEIVEKPWGREEMEYVEGELMVKKLTMFKGRQCSVQLHQIKREVAAVISGQLDVVFVKKDILNIAEEKRTQVLVESLIERRLTLLPGGMAVVEPGSIHYMAAPLKHAVYREVSLGPNETTRIFDPNAQLRKGKDKIT